MTSHQPTRLFVGAMSGTSADGVDVALVSIAGRGLEMSPALAKHHHRPYDASIRKRIFEMRATGDTTLADLAKLGREIALTYSAAVNELLAIAGRTATDISAIAAHGQTLYHDPPHTIQWFDPALLAAETGCCVVSDFRRADLAAGGQGAPLVPFADYILFHSNSESRALLNIGGIANLTFLGRGATADNIRAMDTGPGNCISDHLMRLHASDGPGYDQGGEIALRGQPEAGAIEKMLQPIIHMQGGGLSMDVPEMIRLFEQHAAHLALEDQLATAAMLTAQAVRRPWLSFQPPATELFVSGGGTKNRAILQHLQTVLGVPVRKIDDLGVSSDAREAMSFAILGAATLDGVPANVQAVTGARRPAILGSVTPRPQP